MPSPISTESSGLDIFRYQDHEVRTISIDGEPWFVLTDLCMALGLTNSSVVASRLDEAALSQAYISSGGQRRNVTVVSEAGMYEVVIRSDKPDAVQFRRWITSEVLPAIRKTGSYGVQELTGPELMARALLEAASTIEARDNRIAELEPAATSWDKLASAAGDYSARDAAQVLSRGGVQIGQNRLFKWLRENKWIDATSRPYQRFVDQGLISERIRSFRIVRTNGEEQLAPPQLRITAKGIDAIRRVLAPATAQIEA